MLRISSLIRSADWRQATVPSRAMRQGHRVRAALNMTVTGRREITIAQRSMCESRTERGYAGVMGAGRLPNDPIQGHRAFERVVEMPPRLPIGAEPFGCHGLDQDLSV